MPTPFAALRFTRGASPWVTVSPRGITLGNSTVPNDGADFGPDNDTTGTVGIQDALNSISVGGMVYVLAGQYRLSQAISNTGHKQIVVFDPGCLLTFTNTNSNGIYIGHNTSNTATYSFCEWFGNGCKIDNGASTHPALNFDMPASSKAAPPLFLTADGFELTNLWQNVVHLQVPNGFGAQPTTSQCLRFCRISRIWVHDFNLQGTGTAFSTSGFAINGSCRYIVFDEVISDGSTIPVSNPGGGNTDYGTLFFRSQQGTCSHITIRDSIFINDGDVSQNNATGEIIELQGTSVGSGTGTNVITSNIVFENCEFYSPITWVVPGRSNGVGNIEIDDVPFGSTTSTSGLITDVLFRRCRLTNVPVLYVYQSDFFGYVKWDKCNFVSPTSPGSHWPTAGSLKGRSPGDMYKLPASLVGNPFSYTNTDGFDVLLTVTGGTGVRVSLNGVSSGTSQGLYRVKSGDTLSTSSYTGTLSVYKTAG